MAFAPSTTSTRRCQKADYLPDRGLSTALFLALALEKPLLLEGEAGVGKTEAAKSLADALGGAAHPPAVLRRPRRRARRLRVELSAPAASTSAPRGGAVSRGRALRRRVPHPAAAARGDRPRRAGGAADRRGRPRRRGVRGVPARGAVGLPDHHPRAGHDPRAAATGGRAHLEPHARAARRAQAARLFHWIGHPSIEREVDIVKLRVPGIPSVWPPRRRRSCAELRGLDLSKPPGVAETIDWAMALNALGPAGDRRRAWSSRRSARCSSTARTSSRCATRPSRARRRGRAGAAAAVSMRLPVMPSWAMSSPSARPARGRARGRPGPRRRRLARARCGRPDPPGRRLLHAAADARPVTTSSSCSTVPSSRGSFVRRCCRPRGCSPRSSGAARVVDVPIDRHTEGEEDVADGDPVELAPRPTSFCATRTSRRCTADEFRRLRRLIQTIARTRPRRSSRRREPDARGDVLDMRRLLRSRCGQVVTCRQRRTAPARWCRASSWCSATCPARWIPYSRALLLFLHAVVGSGRGVEAFAFGTRLSRLTPDLATRDPEAAIERCTEAVVDWGAGHADRRLAEGVQRRVRSPCAVTRRGGGGRVRRLGAGRPRPRRA